MKLCKNCKHCGFNQPGYGMHKSNYYILSTVPCLRIPPVKKINLITGDEYIERALLCWNERDPVNPNTEEDICGAEAKYFELL